MTVILKDGMKIVTEWTTSIDYNPVFQNLIENFATVIPIIFLIGFFVAGISATVRRGGNDQP